MISTSAYIAAVKQLVGRTRKVRLVVMHATQSKERAGAARAVAAWFANPDARGSAHVTCDDAETIQSVKPENTAAGAPGANQDGYHIEQVGYSEQGETEWLDAYSEKVIERAATAAREACEHFGIPKVWLSVQDVRDGKAGITDHNTITKATGKGTHWDPGPYWPRGRFMALVTQEGDEVTDEDILKIAQAVTVAQQPQVDALRKRLDDVQTNLAALQRRVFGVPLMADGKEQHKADEDTGRRLQALLDR